MSQALKNLLHPGPVSVDSFEVAGKPFVFSLQLPPPLPQNVCSKMSRDIRKGGCVSTQKGIADHDRIRRIGVGPHDAWMFGPKGNISMQFVVFHGVRSGFDFFDIVP